MALCFCVKSMTYSRRPLVAANPPPSPAVARRAQFQKCVTLRRVDEGRKHLVNSIIGVKLWGVAVTDFANKLRHILVTIMWLFVCNVSNILKLALLLQAVLCGQFLKFACLTGRHLANNLRLITPLRKGHNAVGATP